MRPTWFTRERRRPWTQTAELRCRPIHQEWRSSGSQAIRRLGQPMRSPGCSCLVLDRHGWLCYAGDDAQTPGERQCGMFRRQ